NSKAVSYGEEGAYGKYMDLVSQINRSSSNMPFVNSNVDNDPKSKGRNRGTTTTTTSLKLGGSTGTGFSTKFGTVNVGPKFSGELSRSITTDLSRGGIYVYLKDGENLLINNGKPALIGTWFNLNYPNRTIIQKK
ncbi:MAG: hypothetical protein M3342_24655, partial [Bacteroidota bacterium]|nr:hypothetical protein [Bacteroidota bacterium]